jgi:hypothetical protein
MQSAEGHRSDTNAIALRAEDRGRAVVRKHGVESGFAIPQRSVTGAKTKKEDLPRHPLILTCHYGESRVQASDVAAGLDRTLLRVP